MSHRKHRPHINVGNDAEEIDLKTGCNNCQYTGLSYSSGTERWAVEPMGCIELVNVFFYSGMSAVKIVMK